MKELKSITILAIIIYIFSCNAWVESAVTEDFPTYFTALEPPESKLIPERKSNFDRISLSNIRRYIDAEEFDFLNSDIVRAQYGRDSRLHRVKYDNGTTVDYSYSFEDSNGNGVLSSVALDIGDINNDENELKLVFTEDTLTITRAQDVNGGGVVNEKDEELLEKKKLLNIYDSDGNGKLDSTDSPNYEDSCSIDSYDGRQYSAELFDDEDRYPTDNDEDVNGDGVVDKTDKELLENNRKPFDLYDIDGDGEIDDGIKPSLTKSHDYQERGLIDNDDRKPDSGKSPGDKGNDPNESDDEDIIIYFGPGKEWDLDKIARNPVDDNIFDGLRDATGKAKEEKDIANEEIRKSTGQYCQKVIIELESRHNSLKSEDIDLSEHLKGLSAKDLTAEEKKELLDETVAYIDAEANKGEGEKRVAQEFLTVYEMYTDEFLKEQKGIYEGSVEKIVEYMNTVIDKLLSQKITLFFRGNRDEKLDLYLDINKPEKKEQKPSQE